VLSAHTAHNPPEAPVQLAHGSRQHIEVYSMMSGWKRQHVQARTSMVESLAGSHSFKLSSIAAVACITGD